MTYDEFVATYSGKATDYDRTVIGVQCVDLIKLYLDKVFGIKIGAIGNAEAYWRRYGVIPALKNNFDKIPNTPSFIPQKGDIVVWGTGLSKTGHIAIATGEGDTHSFASYDQNWGSKEMKKVVHNYKNVEGVLRAKDQSNIVDRITNQDIFDSDLYYWKYEDLRKKVGSDYNKLFAHWIDFGIKEGRIGSYIFDAHFYYNKYKDLQKAFGKDWLALYNHYVAFGLKEGRQASVQFDPIYYKEHNPDLNIYGNNYILLALHFKNYRHKRVQIEF